MFAPARLAVALLAVLAWAAPARAGDVPPEAVVAAIPFAPSDGVQQVRIDVAPPGKPPLLLVLDTGASHSLMSPSAARAAGISVRRNKSAPYRRSTRIGRDVQFHVDARSSDTGSRMGFEYAVLGGDFLAHYVVEIDFPASAVRFLDPDRFAVPETAAGAGEAVARFSLAGNRPSLEVEIDGRPARVLLDTGMAATAVLSGAAARRIGLDPDALPDGGWVLVSIGSVPVRAHQAASVRIGGLDLGPLRLLVSPSGLYNLGSGQGDSLLGLGALTDLVLRIDYPRRRLWLGRTDR